MNRHKGNEAAPARRAGVSLGLARKKTKPGWDGAGGRNEPTSTSRAAAGSGAACRNSALSAAPSTSSLLCGLATAARGAATSCADTEAECGGAAGERDEPDAGSRAAVGNSEENTDEEAMGGKETDTRAREWFARERRLIHKSRRDEARACDAMRYFPLGFV